MSNKNRIVLLLLVMMVTCLSCKKPSATITSQPIPFSSLPRYAQGIDQPENSWFFQIPSSQNQPNKSISLQSDPEGNVFFISRDQLFYSLSQTGELRWKKEGGFRPLLCLADSNSLMTYRDDIKLYNRDGNIKSIWIETGETFLGPDGCIYTTLPSEDNKMIIFSSLDSQGDLRWKAPYQVRYGGSVVVHGVWFDTDNNVYFFVEDTSEDKKFYDITLFSFSATGTPRWKKNFPNHKTAGFPFNQVFQSFIMLPLHTISDEEIQPNKSKWLVGLNQNGDEIWRKEENRDGLYPVPFQTCPNGQVITALSSMEEDASYVTSYNHLGEVIWERKLVGRDISPIQVDRDNHVYIAAGGMNGDRYLYAFYPDGTTKWKLKIPSPLGTKVETLYLGNDRSLYLTLLDKNSLFKISQANP